jgi:pilus assembly protein Flp/PilA
MRSRFWKLLSRARTLMREDGQDLVEYALLVALISFAATSSEKAVAGKINTAFQDIGATLTANIT